MINQIKMLIYFDGDEVLPILDDDRGVVDLDLNENFPSSLVSEKDDPWRDIGLDVFGVTLDLVEPDFFVGIFDGVEDEWYPKDVEAVIEVEGSDPPCVLSLGLCYNFKDKSVEISFKNTFIYLPIVLLLKLIALV